MGQSEIRRLADAAPELERILTRPGYCTPPLFGISEIRCETVMVTMRDGVHLATDLYLRPTRSAPAIALPTPYDRASDRFVGNALSFARRGYVVVTQDCRGTGDSEPDSWDYYIYDSEDSFELVERVSQQAWFDGFVGACGGSYIGQTQWCMSMHPPLWGIIPAGSNHRITT